MPIQVTWDKRFMRIANEVGSWSSCLKENRHVGAVIVKNNRILATGYNGAPSGVLPCRDRERCLRDEENINSGERLEVCYAVHAEQNAILQAAKLGISIDGATLYCTHYPCSICAKMIVNAGISRMVYIYDYPDDFSNTILSEGGLKIEQYVE